MRLFVIFFCILCVVLFVCWTAINHLSGEPDGNQTLISDYPNKQVYDDGNILIGYWYRNQEQQWVISWFDA